MWPALNGGSEPIGRHVPEHVVDHWRTCPTQEEGWDQLGARASTSWSRSHSAVTRRQQQNHVIFKEAEQLQHLERRLSRRGGNVLRCRAQQHFLNGETEHTSKRTWTDTSRFVLDEKLHTFPTNCRESRQMCFNEERNCERGGFA